MIFIFKWEILEENPIKIRGHALNENNEYEYIVINKDFEETIERIQNIISLERLRRHDFENFVKELLG